MESVAETLRQLAFLGTVLAGFAVTFLVGLLNAPTNRRSVDYTAGAALVAAVCLIVCAVVSVTGVFYIVDRPALRSATDLPLEVRAAIMGAVRWAGMGFMLGMVALLASLGTSGWIRSRKLGILSSLLAAVTLLLLLYFMRYVVRLI